MGSSSMMAPGLAVDWVDTMRNLFCSLAALSACAASNASLVECPLETDMNELCMAPNALLAGFWAAAPAADCLVAVLISASKVRASMTAWYTRRLVPSEATKHALGELEMLPSVVLKTEQSEKL